ncbi:hypothetical protein FF2_046056 [Malus domestica]
MVDLLSLCPRPLQGRDFLHTPQTSLLRLFFHNCVKLQAPPTSPATAASWCRWWCYSASSDKFSPTTPWSSKQSERNGFRGISDEEDDEVCRKKLRLSEDQSAISTTSSPTHPHQQSSTFEMLDGGANSVVASSESPPTPPQHPPTSITAVKRLAGHEASTTSLHPSSSFPANSPAHQQNLYKKKI